MTRVTSGGVAAFATPLTVALVGTMVVLSHALGTHVPPVDGPQAATRACHRAVLDDVHHPARPVFVRDKLVGGHASFDDYGAVSYRTARGDGETSYFTCSATYTEGRWSTITVVSETVVTPARTSPSTTT